MIQFEGMSMENLILKWKIPRMLALFLKLIRIMENSEHLDEHTDLV